MTTGKGCPPEFSHEAGEINRLALKLHGSRKEADAFAFRSLAEHVTEVRALLDSGDGHWKAETVDIIIHALTLLERHGVKEEEIRALLAKRAGRFKEKITEALKKNSSEKNGQ